jgi:serine protease inhibitor
MKFNLIIFSLLFLKSSISSAKAQDFNPDLSMKIAKQILNLSQKLVEKNLMTGDDKTIAMSPISVSAALQLCLLGAHGKTFDELKSVLGYNESM